MCFTLLGTALETLHAFKVGAYLDVGNEARRLTWRLAHAHGALLGLVNVAFAYTCSKTRRAKAGRLRLASTCLLAATLLLPVGFFLGGAFAVAGDPGLGIALVPAAAVALVISLAITLSSVA
jgi:hypothetical protein